MHSHILNTHVYLITSLYWTTFKSRWVTCCWPSPPPPTSSSIPTRLTKKFYSNTLHPQYSILHPHYLYIINPPPPPPPPPPISSSIPTRFSQKFYFYTPSPSLHCDKNISLLLQDNQPPSSTLSPSLHLMSPIFAPLSYIQGLNEIIIKSLRTSIFVRSFCGFAPSDWPELPPLSKYDDDDYNI